MTKTSGDLCAVSDRDELASVVEVLVSEIGGGSETKTADAIGISQSTLNRLRWSNTAQVTRSTAIALERAAKELERDNILAVGIVTRLRIAILAPEPQRYMQAFGAWCEERMTRWQERDGVTWKVGAFKQIEPVATDPPFRQELLRLLWQRVHREFPELFARFRDEMVRRNVDESRQEVAVLRIIEPLLEAAQSAYIERSYSELTERERRDFLDAGIKRELILLDREPALTRARRIATEGADCFAKREGERALYAKERTPAPPNGQRM